MDIEWLTTWGVMANTDLSPRIGFPGRLPVHAKGNGHAWKAPAALRVLTSQRPRPLIRTDDLAWDVEIERELRAPAVRAGVELLMIKPVASRGLRPQHLDQIEDFIQRQARARRQLGPPAGQQRDQQQ